ncbi:MAG: cation:proton antiporter [Gemmatimonadota bacterium]|nr:MAG: cation:proton antiporter [Gemmatimonadota bacterium]
MTKAWRRVRRPAAILAGLWIVFGTSLWELPGRLTAGEPTPPAAPTVGQEDGGHGESAPAEVAEEEAGHAPEISHVFLVLIAILLLGKLFGEGAERLGQPAVLGELLAGVLLGGSMLGVIPPSDTPLGEVIHVFAEIGVSILLFEIGLETDLKEMFRVGKEAAAVALVGVVLPFGLGFLYWYSSNPAIGVHPDAVSFWVVAIFVGATLTATSVGITARVLSDLRKMHTSEARIIIGAAVIDDVLGIVILAVVAGLASGAAVGVLAVGKIFAFAVGFLVLAVVVGNRAAPYLFNVVDRMRVRGVLLVTAVCFALLLAALADLSGSAMIIGAFAAGIILSSTNQFDAVVERIEPVADVFTPIFFVVVGAPVNVRLFVPGSADFSAEVLTVGLILTVIAVIGKVLAGFVVRRPGLNRTAIGVGMVPRGEVGLIFAAIGLREGILSNAVYSAVLIMVILSTFLVPPILKQLLAHSSDSSEEAETAGLSLQEHGQELAGPNPAASRDPGGKRPDGSRGRPPDHRGSGRDA